MKRKFIKYLTLTIMFVFFSVNICTAVDKKAVVGIWLLESDKEIKDASGNGNDGKVKGSLKLVDGKFGKALLYPGQKDNHVEITHSDSLDLTTFSFTLWVKLQPTPTYQCVFIKTADGLTENYSGYIMDSTKVFWTRFTSGGPTKWGFQKFGATAITDDKWHHLAGTYDMKSVKSYVDGVVEAEASFSDKPDKSAGPLTIGACTGFAYPVMGIIDDVGLFNVALSENDIKNIMDRGLNIALSVSNMTRLTTTWANIKK